MTVVQSVESVEMREIMHTDDFAKVSLVFHDVPLVVEVFVVVRLLGDGWVVSSICASVSDGHWNVVLGKNVILFRLFGNDLRCEISFRENKGRRSLRFRKNVGSLDELSRDGVVSLVKLATRTLHPLRDRKHSLGNARDCPVD